MSDCPDWGPDGGHDYRDEDTKQYVGVCSCGAVDPATRAATIPHSAGGPLDPPF